MYSRANRHNVSRGVTRFWTMASYPDGVSVGSLYTAGRRDHIPAIQSSLQSHGSNRLFRTRRRHRRIPGTFVVLLSGGHEEQGC
jgi:hypothetical protein